jgi:hypothetical protein
MSDRPTNAEVVASAAASLDDDVSPERLEAMQALAKLSDAELILVMIGGIMFLSRNKGCNPLAALEVFTELAAETITLSMVSTLTGVPLEEILGATKS